MNIQTVNPDLVIEASWEVCNKIGGIYTVLSTKAKSLHTIYKDKLIFIGPDVWSEENQSPYFIESKTLLKGWREKAVLPEGVTVRIGRWDVPGKPIVILVKFDALYAAKDELYGTMWNLYGVDSLHAYGDYDEACTFSHATALVIESLAEYNKLEQGKGLIAHFNEWTTGMGLLHVKWKLPKAATVFTTHATSIGRSICGNNKPLYDFLNCYYGDQMAQELNMQSKHSLEKAAAHQADCFTTVSDVTAAECAQLLDKTPDIVTPNGFEPRFVPKKAEMPGVKYDARKLITTVAKKLTGKKFGDDVTIIATSGRCEYRNKGIDEFLDAMNRLRETSPDGKYLALVLVPAWCKDARVDLQKAFESESSTALPDPVITHTLNNTDSDVILNRIHQLNFNNNADDNVTVIYVPCYLNGSDGIFNKTYYELLPGVDITVFPSYYEPWGYTPLESIAFGIPTVTTTLSGFGQWVLSNIGTDFSASGVDVIQRNDNNYHAVCDAIAEIISNVSHHPKEYSGLEKVAQKTAKKAEWGNFIITYVMAFEIALSNSERRNKPQQ